MSLLSGKRPSGLGVRNGRLAPCPKTPNCVCSQCDGKGAIAPIAMSGDQEQWWDRLKKTVTAMRGHSVVEDGADYLYVECRSPLLGFVDDLELYRDQQAALCHVRSASRLGYSDLGKNRQRVETIRKQLA